LHKYLPRFTNRVSLGLFSGEFTDCTLPVRRICSLAYVLLISYNTLVIEIRRYITRAGKDAVGDWLLGLGDVQARARIAARIDRAFADHTLARAALDVSDFRIGCVGTQHPEQSHC